MGNNETKLCPYCGETIRQAAKKCHYCGEWLTETDMVKPEPQTHVASPVETPEEDIFDNEEPFYVRNKKTLMAAVCGLLLCVAGYFGWMLLDSFLTGSGEVEIEYFAVYNPNTKRWGLANAKGEYLVNNMFENRPSAVVGNRFTVKNDDGETMLYTAEENPKLIGKYSSVGAFTDNVAPAVVEKGKWITLINRNGDVVKDLKEIDGKSVEVVKNFAEGMAVVMIDGKCGYINKKGKLVIEPQFDNAYSFNEGKAIVIINKSDNYQEYAVINKKGEILFTLPEGAKIYEDDYCFHDGYIIANNQDSFVGYLINSKGEYKEFQDKSLSGSAYNGDFVINSNGKFSMQRGDATTINSYDNIDYNGKIAMSSNNDGINYLLDDKCMEARLPFSGKCMALPHNVKYNDEIIMRSVGDDSDNYNLVYLDGRAISADIQVDSQSFDYEDAVVTEYLDAEKLADMFVFTNNGINGMSFDDNMESVINNFGYDYNPNYFSEGRAYIERFYHANGVDCLSRVYFDSDLISTDGSDKKSFVRSNVKNIEFTFGLREHNDDVIKQAYDLLLKRLEKKFSRKYGFEHYEDEVDFIPPNSKYLIRLVMNSDNVTLSYERIFTITLNLNGDDDLNGDDEGGCGGYYGLIASIPDGITEYEGTMTGFPIEFTIHRDDNKGVLYAIYKNVNYGTKMRLEGESLPADDGNINFFTVGRKEEWHFNLTGDYNHITGYAESGDKHYKVILNKK
ncbi:MAG: WG repeat-containing protein [Prevotella sp.]|nr:WG repeat-containing protein [Prevotella sp.]